MAMVFRLYQGASPSNNTFAFPAGQPALVLAAVPNVPFTGPFPTQIPMSLAAWPQVLPASTAGIKVPVPVMAGEPNGVTRGSATQV
jgi:hypothetical protein